MFTNRLRKVFTNASFSALSGCCSTAVSTTWTPEPSSDATLPSCTRSRTGGRNCARIADTIEISATAHATRSEEHTSELQSRLHLVCRLLLEKKKKQKKCRYKYLKSVYI